MLELIKDSIIFAFEDAVVKGTFVEQTSSGIYLGRSAHRAANAPRWGKVVSVGPDVREVQRGDRILIEPTMWTTGMEYDGVTLWRTTEKYVMAIDE
jgi:co-chaperonin GroES (HSP10)